MGVGMSNGTRSGGRPHGLGDFAPESVVPDQWGGESTRPWPGWKKLMLAILLDAHRVLQRGRHLAACARTVGLGFLTNYRDTEAWLRSDEEGEVHSVRNIAAQLGVSIELVRRKLGELDGDGVVFESRIVQRQASRNMNVYREPGAKKRGRPAKVARPTHWQRA